MEAEREAALDRLNALSGSFAGDWVFSHPPSKGSALSWDFVILDRFRTPRKEFAAWSALAPLIGIDEGGPCRDKFDFLIDLLPGLPGAAPANLSAPGLLPLPKNRRSSFFPSRDFSSENRLKLLVSFGAEDPGGLALPAVRALADRAFVSGAVSPEITLAAPGVSRFAGSIPQGVRVLDRVPDLKEELAGYDLVITHFGLTAFEALYARTPALLLSPTAYHEKLARNAGFVSAGMGPAAAGKLGALLFSGSGLAPSFFASLCRKSEETAARYGLSGVQSRTLAAFLAAAEPLEFGNCLCRTGKDRHVLARFPSSSGPMDIRSLRTYRRCGSCGLITMDRMSPPPIEYGTDYFFGFYKKQYGKTYLEDFPGLMEAGRKRLGRIKNLLAKGGEGRGLPGGERLLDIGCAYGPFLQAAKAENFSPFGIEPAEDAARYVRENLGIPCRQGFFPAALYENQDGTEYASFSVITFWYVIEHFDRLGTVLKETGALLKPGGVLAFSSPSYSGISGRKSLTAFLKNSPADHWTVMSPRTCRKLLGKYGFSLKKTVVTGHHPERFPLAGRFLEGKKGNLYHIVLALSRLFRLGDTFEAYAVKEKTDN
jgi:2-polyprenyl-3-methyl-5-hydroxy-6-metoxy-1,4-benzoquinol methylase